MNETVQQLLNNQGENYILPFFWQHGETEEVLREYMAAIDASNIKAVCVESRPHPDFCGEKWWQDMDVILDEARKRHMKVWILDDSHFPTGFANGALKDYPDCYCRQSICCRAYDLSAEDCAGLTVSGGGQRSRAASLTTTACSPSGPSAGTRTPTVFPIPHGGSISRR